MAVLACVAGVVRPTLVREPVAETKVSGGSKEAGRVGCGVNRPPFSALPLAPCKTTSAGLVDSLTIRSVVPKLHCCDRSDNNGGSGGCLDRFGLIDCRFVRWDNR